ncbi:MAG: hypothetical protein N2C14_26415, partial [Planctomycetales bacterium]
MGRAAVLATVAMFGCAKPPAPPEKVASSKNVASSDKITSTEKSTPSENVASSDKPDGADENKTEPAVQAEIEISLAESQGPSRVAFDVSGIPESDLERIARAKWTAERWNGLFAVYAVQSSGEVEGLPAMLG